MMESLRVHCHRGWGRTGPSPLEVSWEEGGKVSVELGRPFPATSARVVAVVWGISWAWYFCLLWGKVKTGKGGRKLLLDARSWKEGRERWLKVLARETPHWYSEEQRKDLDCKLLGGSPGLIQTLTVRVVQKWIGLPPGVLSSWLLEVSKNSLNVY